MKDERSEGTMLQILDSKTRQKRPFEALKTGRVTMYACGPTVYDSLHLGHARAGITPDIVRRYLEYKGFNVRYVTNFTDVDDKIIKRAIAEKRDWREVTATYMDEYHRMMLALNVKPADAYPRATDHIPEMLEIVRRLMEAKHAYVASDGDIYFDTKSFGRYGELSGRNLEEEEAGLSGRLTAERIAVKKNRGDFLLWKLNKNDREELARGGDRVPRWASPWGDGRPGWHLECSAMSRQYLGVPFDIHCGGQDLLFPHHEDEKAQTECAYHEELGEQESVRYWVHNAFLTVKARPERKYVLGPGVEPIPEGIDTDDDPAVVAELQRHGLLDEHGNVKMSKSLGNVKWLREMIWPEGQYDPMAVRMMLLSSHYRSPIVFEPGMLDEATARLERIYNTLEALERVDREPGAHSDEIKRGFETAMDDDFNTAGALGDVFGLVGHTNQKLAANDLNRIAAGQAYNGIKMVLSVLGIRPHRAKAGDVGDSEKLVELLMQARQEARKAKLFPLSDKIRADLTGLGYQVEDLPGGKWVVKKK
jgi:cysteinyl-tRNA synthetase